MPVITLYELPALRDISRLSLSMNFNRFLCPKLGGLPEVIQEGYLRDVIATNEIVFIASVHCICQLPH